MENSEVPRKNRNQKLNAGDKNKQFTPSGSAAQHSRDTDQQYRNNHSNQQLRENQEQEVYRSEERKHSYQHTDQSFNEQRDQYAEHALNDAAIAPSTETMGGYYGSDYQQADYDQGVDQDNNYYQRYVKADDHTNINAAAGHSESIFSASDLELADATENYLPPKSKSFEEKLGKIDTKKKKVQKEIHRLETDKLQYRNSYKIWKYRLVNEKHAGEKLKTESWHSGKGAFERIHRNTTIKSFGRLKLRGEQIAYTPRKHNRKVKKEERKKDRRDIANRRLKEDLRSRALGNDVDGDDTSEKLRRKSNQLSSGLNYATKRNIRKLKHEFDGYGRLKYQTARMNALEAKQQLISYKSGVDLQRRKAEEAARQNLIREQQKKKIKKEMVQNYKKEYGNYLTRNRNQHKLKKVKKKERRMARKRVKTLLASGLSLLLILVLVFLLIMFFIAMLLNMSSESYVNSTSQNDYDTMTSVTEYFREKEAELEKYIQPENLEPIIAEEEPDIEIYEYIYELDDICFDANTLVAYLSARYNEFNLDMVKADLDEIFELYYQLSYEIKMEYREIPDKIVPICYVRLEKADFYDLLKKRIEDAAKQGQMDNFYLTGNGQQVYGPVMDLDWRKKISSNFGERVHPITKERKFHNGVDIAVPTGTALYSAVNGTVIDSHYSTSAGNMITIQTETGWKVTFMHMDSRVISQGEKVKQGQLVGYSGNTGNSTGPHLHLEVKNAEGEYVNPIFIIPFSTLEASETY